MTRFRPTEEDLKLLKVPLGELFRGEPNLTMPKLLKRVKQARPPFVAAVGDVVSKETESRGVPVNLRIVDHRTLRKSFGEQEWHAEKIYRVANPAGVVTQDSWNAIRDATRQRDSVILVDGEEDLLALPCIVESPDKSLVLYGQPSEGMVVVKVAPSVKAQVNGILERASREES